ncbi:hypothetical protein MUK42_27532 [Musa troglodytarum]|nr:hypothetical protein MUK42_27532 [Musa troglodytarum]
MMERGEEGRVAPGGEVDGAGEAGVAPNVDGNTWKVEGVGALHREDWRLLARRHRID